MSEAKVVHTGDVHIDGGHFGGSNPETKRPNAWEAFHRTWMAICSYSIEHAVDAVVVPGDVFANCRPRPEAVELVFEGLRDLSRAGIEVLMSPGNHELDIDRPYSYRTPLEHFQDLAHVRVLNEPTLVTLDSGLQIGVFPWAERVAYLNPGEATGLSPEEIDELVAARLVERIEDLAAEVDPSRGPAMLAGHLTIGGATVGSSMRGSEMDIAQVFHEPVVALADIDVDPWQHVALSHIHKRQQVGERAWYAGSPDRLTFEDERVHKAFTCVTLRDDGSVGTVESISTPARSFLSVTLAAGEEPSTVKERFGDAPEGTIVRVELPAGADMAFENEVRKYLIGAGAWIAKVHAPPLPRRMEERKVVAEDVRPYDGFSEWLGTVEVSEELRAGALAKAAVLVGRHAPSGEDNNTFGI